MAMLITQRHSAQLKTKVSITLFTMRSLLTTSQSGIVACSGRPQNHKSGIAKCRMAAIMKFRKQYT